MAVMLVLVTKVRIYFNAVILGNEKWELIHTLETYIHTESLFRLKHTTAHHQSKLALKFSFPANMVKQ